MLSDWQPSCHIDALRLRAEVLHKIRGFFLARGVLEVETPLLGHSCGTDPHLDFFTATYGLGSQADTMFLQTSPEFAMKRLLCAGSGSIYQICKAFRNGESGRFHNPEFTLLEWYRVGYNLGDLMTEVAELLEYLCASFLSLKTTKRLSYQDVFFKATGLDPFKFSYEQYCSFALKQHQPEALSLCGDEHGLWLDFIFSHYVQPTLGQSEFCLVHGYPAIQSSLARINQDNPDTVDRVEVFFKGVELGNGYYELQDAQEQSQRFDTEIQIRAVTGRQSVVKDDRLVSALAQGLPECAGIAIGLDRLLMILSHQAKIEDVLSFSIDRA